MKENSDLYNEFNKTAENEYNYEQTKEKETNLSEKECYVGKEEQLTSITDDNAKENKGEINSKTKYVVSSFSSDDQIASQTAKAVGSNSSFLYRILLGLVAVVGSVIVGVNFANGARTENARFVEVSCYDRYISVCIEVLKWSENLKLRITGKNFTEELEIEDVTSNEEYQYENDYNEDNGKRNYFWLYYFAEEGEEGEEITLEIVGSIFLMKDVIETKTVVLTTDEYFKPDFY